MNTWHILYKGIYIFISDVAHDKVDYSICMSNHTKSFKSLGAAKACITRGLVK